MMTPQAEPTGEDQGSEAKPGGITIVEPESVQAGNKAPSVWDIDHEEKARRIAEEDLNRKKKQVRSSLVFSCKSTA
jgi:hypothetical protein